MSESRHYINLFRSLIFADENYICIKLYIYIYIFVLHTSQVIYENVLLHIYL